MGDGTEESLQRVQSALNHLMPYTQEFWTSSVAEENAASIGICPEISSLRAPWNRLVDDALDEATLMRPPDTGYVTQGKNGLHSEHLSYVLVRDAGAGTAAPRSTVVIALKQRYSMSEVEAILSTIPDPEIPVISIRELGILRDVQVNTGRAGQCILRRHHHFSTYGGCPAMDQIRDDIVSALAQAGLTARVTTRFGPGVDDRLDQPRGPGKAACLWHCAAACSWQRSGSSADHDPVRS